MSDETPEIRDKLFKFWNHPERIPNDIYARLLFIFANMHDPHTEASWLGYVTMLLMDPVKAAPKYRERLTKEPLRTSYAACQFKEMTLRTDWRGSLSGSHQPFFSSQSEEDMGEASADGDILQTQQNVWSQTQSLMSQDDPDPEKTRQANFKISRFSQSSLVC